MAPLSVEKVELCDGRIQPREKRAFEMTADPGYSRVETREGNSSNVAQALGGRGRRSLPAGLDKKQLSDLFYPVWGRFLFVRSRLQKVYLIVDKKI